MNVKFSKLMRTAIIINVIITIIALVTHGYYIYRTFETNNQIVQVMEEKQVIRETAIRYLVKEDADLYFPRSITEFSGVIISLVTLAALYIYTQTNGFLSGFMAAFCAVFTSYFGGFLLFYVLLSGKSEIKPKSENPMIRNRWQMYIHEKGLLS